MDIYYKRDLRNSYLVMREEDMKETYKIKMLLSNTIGGLIKFNIQYFDNKPEFYYDISSKYSMKSMFIKRKMLSPDIRAFVCGLEDIVESCREYLLDVNSIILKPEFIFFTSAENKPKFCYYPSNDTDFKDGIRQITQYIMSVINNDDEETVAMANCVLRVITKDEFTIDDIVECLSKPERVKNVLPQEGFESLYSREYLKTEVPFVQSIKGFFTNMNIKKALRDEKTCGSVAEETIYTVDRQEETKTWFDEEETQLLTIKDLQFGLYLKSIDRRNYKDIIPDTFPYIVGKFQKNVDFVIDNKMISRMHAIFTQEDDGYYIEDLNSTNGTYLNDKRLEPHEKVHIKMGDKVTFSTISYIIE